MKLFNKNRDKQKKSQDNAYGWCIQCKRWIPKTQMYGAGAEWFHQCESAKRDLKNGE